MKNDQGEYSALILAAGRSGRMGKPKHSLLFDGHSTFLDEIVKQYRHFGCKQIVVVINNESESYFPGHRSENLMDVVFVVNAHPEWERFYSIQLGLKAFESSTPVFVHNVDNPFVSRDVLASLIANKGLSDYLVPVCQGKGGHPVLLNPKVIKAIIMGKRPDRNFKTFLSQFARHSVPVDDRRILVNINTRRDYLDFKHRAGF